MQPGADERRAAHGRTRGGRRRPHERQGLKDHSCNQPPTCAAGAVGAVLLATVLAACTGPAAQTSGSASRPAHRRPSLLAATPSASSSTSPPKPAAGHAVKSNVEERREQGDGRHPGQGHGQRGASDQGQADLHGHRQQGEQDKGTGRTARSARTKTSWTAGRAAGAGGHVQAGDERQERGQRSRPPRPRKFTTREAEPEQQTFPTLYPLKGSKVGIGMPVVLNFDVPVKNKKSIREEPARHLLAEPRPVAGAGSATRRSATDPKKYWKPGTKVTRERQRQRGQRRQRRLRSELGQDHVQGRPLVQDQDQPGHRRREGLPQRQDGPQDLRQRQASPAGRPAAASS